MAGHSVGRRLVNAVLMRPPSAGSGYPVGQANRPDQGQETQARNQVTPGMPTE
jgi:hypothetical protein